MMLPTERFSRERALFECTYTYRAEIPRPNDWAGETDVSQPIRHETGVTTHKLIVLAPSAALAEAYARHAGVNLKDFEYISTTVCLVQIDGVVATAWGARF